jgi:alpha-beta hydrolase superfamily lysophospholipase
MTKFIFTLIIISIFFTHSSNIFLSNIDTSSNIIPLIDIAQIKKDMKKLDFSAPPVSTPAINNYFQFYNIDFSNNSHYFGTFQAGDKILAAHIFLHEDSQGTIFLLHGYNDHSGILKNLISFCLDQRYSVAVYDFPGHGLSSGVRGSINDFSEYADILKTFVSLCQDSLPKPFHLIGHSTGCAIAFEYFKNNQNKNFQKIFFLAPLIHHAHWGISKIGYFIIRPFTKTVPRIFRKNSSNLSYLKFIKNDPLQTKRLPLKFFRALKKWDKRIKHYAVLERTINILQGTKDSIVDWKYNINFLKKKTDTVHLKLIENAKHQLVNEKASIREKVFEEIKSCLEQ